MVRGDCPVGSYWSDVCPVALLVNIGIAGMLRLFPLARIVELNAFSLSVRLQLNSMPSVPRPIPDAFGPLAVTLTPILTIGLAGGVLLPERFPQSRVWLGSE
jgi:hypothetical protein